MKERDPKKPDPAEEDASMGEAPDQPQPDAPADFKVDLANLTEEDVRELLETARLGAEYLEKLKFSHAEFQNYKKRMERERTDWGRYGIQNFALALLPVLDNLERALETPPSAPEDEASFLEGFRIILQMFHEAFKRFSIEPIDALGRTFDPCFHDAQGFVDAPDHEENTVAVEITRGYMLHDRVLRPSSVLLARRVSDEDAEAPREE
jgi:molecular chaperone GrpE